MSISSTPSTSLSKPSVTPPNTVRNITLPDDRIRIISHVCIFVLSALAITFAALSHPIACAGLLGAASLIFIGSRQIAHTAEQKNKNNALWDAVKNDNRRNIKNLLDLGADINSLNEEGISLLHYAFESNNQEMIKALLGYGANINVQDRYGSTVLAWACGGKDHQPNPTIARLLLQRGAAHSLADEFNRTPLHYAALTRNVEVTQLLLNNQAPTDPRDNNGITALHLACAPIAGTTRNIEVIRLLLTHQASRLTRDRYGNTPLILACSAYPDKNNNPITNPTDDLSIVRLLLENDTSCQLQQQTWRGRTALHVAAYTAAVSGNDTSIISLLIQNEVPIDVPDDWGCTALIYACGSQQQSMSSTVATCLLHNAANPQIPDKDGHTPLYWAQNRGNPEIVQLLTSYGAR